MTQLYPIGTQLITRRLSQAALYMEIFGEKDILFYKNPGYTPDEDEEYKFWMPFFIGDYLEKARVTITEENQKWLSPVPIVGDRYEYDDCNNGRSITIVEEKWLHTAYYQNSTKVLQRTYPNGQRAPVPEWDEVILPQ